MLSSFGLEAVKKYDGSDLQGLPGAAVHFACQSIPNLKLYPSRASNFALSD